jgi:ketosteroid isomerase-like protein
VDAHPSAQLVRAFYDARARGDRAAIRRILAADIQWHDPYPPPHGGDLQGLETVLRDVFDGAAKLTGGSTRLWLEDVLANDRRAVALVGWSSTYRGRTMEGCEVALYTIRDGQIAEARFFPFDRAASDAFFDAGPSG